MKIMHFFFPWLAGGGTFFDLSVAARRLLVAVEGWGAAGLCHALPSCVGTVFNIHLSISLKQSCTWELDVLGLVHRAFHLCDGLVR